MDNREKERDWEIEEEEEEEGDTGLTGAERVAALRTAAESLAAVGRAAQSFLCCCHYGDVARGAPVYATELRRLLVDTRVPLCAVAHPRLAAARATACAVRDAATRLVLAGAPLASESVVLLLHALLRRARRKHHHALRRRRLARATAPDALFDAKPLYPRVHAPPSAPSEAAVEACEAAERACWAVFLDPVHLDRVRRAAAARLGALATLPVPDALAALLERTPQLNPALANYAAALVRLLGEVVRTAPPPEAAATGTAEKDTAFRVDGECAVLVATLATPHALCRAGEVTDPDVLAARVRDTVLRAVAAPCARESWQQAQLGVALVAGVLAHAVRHRATPAATARIVPVLRSTPATKATTAEATAAAAPDLLAVLFACAADSLGVPGAGVPWPPAPRRGLDGRARACFEAARALGGGRGRGAARVAGCRRCGQVVGTLLALAAPDAGEYAAVHARVAALVDSVAECCRPDSPDAAHQSLMAFFEALANALCIGVLDLGIGTTTASATEATKQLQQQGEQQQQQDQCEQEELEARVCETVLLLVDRVVLPLLFGGAHDIGALLLLASLAPARVGAHVVARCVARLADRAHAHSGGELICCLAGIAAVARFYLAALPALAPGDLAPRPVELLVLAADNLTFSSDKQAVPVLHIIGTLLEWASSSSSTTPAASDDDSDLAAAAAPPPPPPESPQALLSVLGTFAPQLLARLLAELHAIVPEAGAGAGTDAGAEAAAGERGLGGLSQRVARLLRATVTHLLRGCSDALAHALLGAALDAVRTHGTQAGPEAALACVLAPFSARLPHAAPRAFATALVAGVAAARARPASPARDEALRWHLALLALVLADCGAPACAPAVHGAVVDAAAAVLAVAPAHPPCTRRVAAAAVSAVAHTLAALTGTYPLAAAVPPSPAWHAPGPRAAACARAVAHRLVRPALATVAAVRTALAAAPRARRVRRRAPRAHARLRRRPRRAAALPAPRARAPRAPGGAARHPLLGQRHGQDPEIRWVL